MPTVTYIVRMVAKEGKADNVLELTDPLRPRPVSSTRHEVNELDRARALIGQGRAARCRLPADRGTQNRDADLAREQRRTGSELRSRAPPGRRGGAHSG
jgi:hypothetical protein